MTLVEHVCALHVFLVCAAYTHSYDVTNTVYTSVTPCEK